ncbi:MAG: peroxiredoxin [Candidatus Delongbacteria bacterium]|nr:peroxiredoxin [Candidatus Delongbacteria bacterium]MBN2834836.1 peroxiredoxin [Candidatus Delongbacteria bacterium]
METINNFCLFGDDNKEYGLESFTGKKVVLYFYPKDNTPGCTTEAVEFHMLKEEFEKLNTVVVGVSKDSLASHLKFKEKHQFSHLLLVDDNLDMMKSLDIYGEKNMYGKITLGVKRTTILLDEQGKIIKRWNNVKAAGHAQKVVDFIKSL